MSWWSKKPAAKEDDRLKAPEYFSAQAAIDGLLKDRDFYKARLFDAWKALAQQQKGMRRMARKIKRLHRELEAAKTAPRE